VPLAKVNLLSKIVREPVSLETPVGSEEDTTLADFVDDRSKISALDRAISESIARETHTMLSKLSPREAKILRMRFGVGEREAHTLEEVGEVFGVTRERIRQIESKALGKLRRPAHHSRLKALLED